MGWRRGFKRGRNGSPLVWAAFAGAALCICLMSAKFLLLIIALILIAFGLLLMFCP